MFDKKTTPLEEYCLLVSLIAIVGLAILAAVSAHGSLLATDDAVIKPRRHKIQMKPGETQIYKLEVENTGTTVWPEDKSYYMNLKFSKDEDKFGLPKHHILEEEVQPKATWKTTLTLKAPNESGTFEITGQMEKQGDGKGFGDYIDVTVVVK